MLNGQRFPFIERTNSAGLSSVMPYLFGLVLKMLAFC
jgi:hypothetical protein